jgi:hypothetical protein
LTSTSLSTSSWCSSWCRRWTLLFWDIVKPSGHHCGLVSLLVWLDPSSSNCNVHHYSGARHMMSWPGTRESVISSRRSFDSSLTRPPNRSWALALPPTWSWTPALPPSRSWTKTRWLSDPRWSLAAGPLYQSKPF